MNDDDIKDDLEEGVPDLDAALDEEVEEDDAVADGDEPTPLSQLKKSDSDDIDDEDEIEDDDDEENMFDSDFGDEEESY